LGADGDAVAQTGERGGARVTRRDWQVGSGGNGARWSAVGCSRKREKWGSRAPTGGPDQHSAEARLKLGFKPIQNIQMVQMKFEFLKTLAGSKGTSPHSKKIK
jgi:hypothetical protein